MGEHDFGYIAGKAVILSEQELAGWGVLGLVIAVFLFWAGYRVGRRKARDS